MHRGTYSKNQKRLPSPTKRRIESEKYGNSIRIGAPGPGPAALSENPVIANGKGPGPWARALGPAAPPENSRTQGPGSDFRLTKNYAGPKNDEKTRKTSKIVENRILLHLGSHGWPYFFTWKYQCDTNRQTPRSPLSKDFGHAALTQ